MKIENTLSKSHYSSSYIFISNSNSEKERKEYNKNNSRQLFIELHQNINRKQREKERQRLRRREKLEERPRIYSLLKKAKWQQRIKNSNVFNHPKAALMVVEVKQVALVVVIYSGSKSSSISSHNNSRSNRIKYIIVDHDQI